MKNQTPSDEVCETVKLPCLYCGKVYEFDLESEEAKGIFNVFCPNGECEDASVWRDHP